MSGHTTRWSLAAECLYKLPFGRGFRAGTRVVGGLAEPARREFLRCCAGPVRLAESFWDALWLATSHDKLNRGMWNFTIIVIGIW